MLASTPADAQRAIVGTGGHSSNSLNITTGTLDGSPFRRMNPFEIERMQWEEGDTIAGLLLEADGAIGRPADAPYRSTPANERLAAGLNPR